MPRIIPRLDIKGSNLVKGIHLEGLKILGNPNDFSKYFYANGADELLYMDSVASLYGRNSLNEFIETTVKEIFIPLTVGGGLRSIADISAVLNSGADKVAINTEAINRPEFISEAVKKFGASTIMVEIQTKRQLDGTYIAFTDNGRNPSCLDSVEWAKQVEQLGAGEILITSIDRDGTGLGFDIDIVKQISESVNIPVIAGGGAGKIDHIIELTEKTEINGVGLASVLHYPFVHQLMEKGRQFGKASEFSVIQESYSNTRIIGTDVRTVKKILTSHGIECRLDSNEQTFTII
jgi:imidazole glycerol-phosphate synthase subunit HisF